MQQRKTVQCHVSLHSQHPKTCPSAVPTSDPLRGILYNVSSVPIDPAAVPDEAVLVFPSTLELSVLTQVGRDRACRAPSRM